ncbi:hypothetical protein ACJMK2_029011 [Sinanodonta woodiana]|uniref:Uncharacterized protein n=1 Tax=Sinanodonta woodiana TaxID=1069815 RepID=A0ABD3XCI0_SINWO
MAMHSATTGVGKRLKAFVKVLEKFEEISIVCLGRRIKTVKVYTYRETHSDEMLTALKPGNNVKHFHEDDVNTNRRNIIIKVNDGPVYILDQYLCSSLEKEMKSRPVNICRHVIYLKYNEISDRFTETRRTGNKVEGIMHTAIDNSDAVRELCKIHMHPWSLTSKGQNKERMTGINRQLECDSAHSKNVYPVIDAMYNSPLIRDRESSNHNGHHRSERSTSNYHLQYLPRYPLFCEYITRLSTFRNWRHCLDPKMLAENGFFYQGVGDTVACYFCGVALMHWGTDDDVLLEHLKLSPDCGYLVKSLGTRTIHQYLDPVQDGVTARDFSTANPEKQMTRPLAESFVHHSRTPRNPSYQSFGVRVSTYPRFPNYNDININDLAEAGFYYTGTDDLVRCYWCDLGLKEWEFGDDPYFEHAKYLPDCNHLLTLKGKQFIASVQRTYKPNLQELNVCAGEVNTNGVAREEKERDHKNHSPVKTKALHLELETGQHITILDVLDTPAAKSILEHGYSKEIVKAAIRKLQIKDQSFPTAMQILDVILQAEDNGMDLVTQDLVLLDIQKAEALKGSKDEESIELLAENHRLKSLMLCKQCQARNRTILFLPCSHIDLCDICAKETDVCLKCKQQIKQKVKTYMS